MAPFSIVCHNANFNVNSCSKPGHANISDMQIMDQNYKIQYMPHHDPNNISINKNPSSAYHKLTDRKSSQRVNNPPKPIQKQVSAPKQPLVIKKEVASFEEVKGRRNQCRGLG